jgi:hypothetical protein
MISKLNSYLGVGGGVWSQGMELGLKLYVQVKQVEHFSHFNRFNCLKHRFNALKTKCYLLNPVNEYWLFVGSLQNTWAM